MRPSLGGRGLLGVSALLMTSSSARSDGARPFKAEVSAPSDIEPLGNPELEALGRREAARIAAGRIEVAVSASADIAGRYFKYSDPVGPLPTAYRLPIAPMASLALETYPWASSTVPVLRDLGFRGRFSQGFALGSETPQGVKIDTSWTRFGGDVRERFMLPGARPIELGVSVGADASYFGMRTTIPVPALVPAAQTVAIRLGIDGRMLVAGRLSILMAAAYLVATSPGEIYERFRSPHVFGIDGELGAAFGIVPGLEARLAGRYTRYVASFKPIIGDPIVAGGALDEQVQLGLGIRYAH